MSSVVNCPRNYNIIIVTRQNPNIVSIEYLLIHTCIASLCCSFIVSLDGYIILMFCQQRYAIKINRTFLIKLFIHVYKVIHRFMNTYPDIDDCSAGPCIHGACQDQVHGYICHCDLFHVGETCHQRIPLLQFDKS